ncbi:MAG: hypothetical protein FWD29_09540 [Micrococcales bacterium]|nr:hypothetical protein [Micrococcales bacterium]
MAQIPDYDEAGPALVEEIEHLAGVVDYTFCQRETTRPGQVISVRTAAQDDGRLTVVWSGVIIGGLGGPAHPSLALVCVTLDSQTGQVLNPGADVAVDRAALAAIARAVEQEPGHARIEADYLGDWLLQADPWADYVPEVQGCQWGDETVVVISQPFVYGGWLPLAVRDGQARLTRLVSL